jgi:hypothetical protein
VLEAGTLLMAALLHTGAPIPLGPIVLAEPRIIPAIIAEGLCGLLLAVAACAFFARASWAWRAAAVGAHGFAIAGVLLGTFALAVGAGPRTELNDVYHRVILLALLAGLGLLLTPAGKWVLAS